MRGADADQLEESREVEVFISGSPKKPDTDGIQNKITDTATHTISSNSPNVSSEKKIEAISTSSEKNFEAIPTYKRKTNAKSAVNKTPVPIVVTPTPVVVTGGEGSGIPNPPSMTTPVVVTGGEGSGIPNPPGSGIPNPPGSGIPNPPGGIPSLRPPLSVKTFMRKLENNFRPALKELEKELKGKAEKEREIAKETALLKDLAEWHPIALALKCIDNLNDDDEVIKKNEERKEKGEGSLPTLNRDKFKQSTCIALERCAKDFKVLSSPYSFNDCMMRLLLAFDAWNEVNEKTVLEIFQEKLSSFWLDAFTYFVTTPKDELTRAYDTYRQEMIKRIKQTGDKRYCCYGFPRGAVEYYDSYEECRDNCVNFVVFDERKNDIFSDSMYAGLLCRYVSRCDTVATCKKTDLVTLRNDYIMRLAKLLLRDKHTSGSPTGSAYRNNLLKSVINEVTKEVTLNCTDKSLTEAEKKHKGEEIQVLIHMNKDSLFKEIAGTEELGTKEGNIRFIQIVEMALSGMKKVSKTEGADWSSHLDADLFSFFGINESSIPKIPFSKKWFTDAVIKKTLKELQKTMENKKDANVEELKGMVELFFWQKIKDCVSDTTSKFYTNLNSSLMGSVSIVDRDKIRKALSNVKEADLKKVVPGLLERWNTLVKSFTGKASLLEMKATKKDEKGNAVEAVVPMTSTYFEKLMSDIADGILKLKVYSDLAEKESKAYAKVKLFPIASKLRKIVIDSRNKNSDTLTVKFDRNEFLCMKEASQLCKGLLKLVLSYAKAKELVLEGSWIHEFLASCPKDNVKSLTLKDGSFGIGCLGKISTPIDEVTFEGMNLETLKALEQFLYLKEGNSLTLKNVTCREDYYEGEPGAIQDIQDNGVTVQIEGCSWYKNGVRPIGLETAGAMPAATGGDITTTGMSTPRATGRGTFTFPKLKTTTTTSTGSGSSATDPFADVRGKMKKSTTTGMSTTEGSAAGGNPFLGGRKLKGAPTNGTAKPEEKDPLADIRDKLKGKPADTSTSTSKKVDSSNPWEGILKKNVMHPGMLDKKQKEDFNQKLEDDNIKQGTDIEDELLNRLEQEWNNLPAGQDIPVDVPFCKLYLKKVIEKAVKYAKDRNSSVVLSGDFEKETGNAFDSTHMLDVAEELKDAPKIKTDIKSSYGENISFQSQLFEAMSKLKKKGKIIKTKEIEVSGWNLTSGDSKKVLEAVGDLGLKKFEVSYMDESTLARSDSFSISNNQDAWTKVLKNTEKVSFKNQKMNSTALGGLLNAVNTIKKNGNKVGEIELPKQKRKPGAPETAEEKLTKDILKEISTP